MNKAKGKNSSSNTKNPPVNINISFNINPKSILHHQIPSQIKFPSTLLQDPIVTASKNRGGKHKKSIGDANKIDGGEKSARRGQTELLPDGEFDKKQVDKIKKKFLNRINNMDILLESPPAQNKMIVKKEEENLSSIMSEKMPQYEALPNKQSTDQIQFTLNPKSKVILGREMSKILPIYPTKKSAKKMLPNQNKQSKILTHYKGYSTFTDVKCNSQRITKKMNSRPHSTQMKKNKLKQENLQQKLERFKLDMMKLTLLYDENEVLKTKLSSEYYNNIRSRQISKDTVDLGKINEIQKHEKIDQIKSFQAIQAEKKLALKRQTQSFKKIKDVYQQLAKKKDEQFEEHKQCTENIVEHYKQINLQQNSNTIIPPRQSHSLSQKQDSLKSWKEESINKSDNKLQVKNSIELTNFMKFLEQKMRDNSEIDEMTMKIKKLLSQYESISKQNQQQQQQQIPDEQNGTIGQKQKSYQINEQVVPIGKIDDGINKQLEMIPCLKDDLVQNHQMSGDLMFQLQIWQQNYKNELLKIKGRMWKQYKNIKSIIEGRINNGLSNQRVIQTRASKKQNRIMKCLSEKILTKYQHNIILQGETIEQLIQSRQNISQKGKESSIILKQQHLQVEQSLSDENSIIQTDLEIAESHPIFIPSSSDITQSKQQIQSKEDNMLISSLIQIQMDEDKKAQQRLLNKNTSLSKQYNLTEEDKQDIFQFIFLDICIQLYQEALQNQMNPRSPESNQAVQRLLKSIEVYMCEQKRLKAQRNNRKIGISTNMNAVKDTIHQMNQFLQSEYTIKNNPLKVKDRVINKLNIPLGPSQFQILRSLRLSIFDNQIIQDYDDNIEEGDLLVMEPDIFLYFQNEVIGIQKINFPKYYQDEKRDQQRINFLKNCTHIHHKAIFDCINENLDYHRLFGIWGKPFSWKKAAFFNRQITQQDLPSILNRSASEVMKCTAFVCGLMKDKQESLVKDIATDDNYIKKLQDQRIYKLLEDFVYQMDQKWYFHDDQQTQILVQISHIVWTIIIKEVLRDLQIFLK